jgi:MFS family permease
MARHRIVLVFSALSVLVSAGYGVMFTVLDDYRDKYHIDGSLLGLIVAVGFFSSFVAQVLLAPLADRGHARTLALAGLALHVVGLIGMAYGTTAAVLLVARVVMGTGAGVVSPAARRIVILAEPDRLGHNLGRLLSADVGGFAMGPAIAAVLVGPFGLAAPFIVIAVLSAAFAPILLRTRVEETTEPTTERFAFDLLRHRPYAGAVMVGTALFLMIGTFDALWVLVLSDLHSPQWMANIGITLFAVPFVVFGSAGGRLAQRVGPLRLGAVGLLIGAAFMVLYGQLPTAGWMLAVGLVHALNDGLTVTSTGVAVGVVAPPDRQAGAQGLLGGVQTLVGGLTAMLAGWLYQHHGRAAAYTTCTVAMVVVVTAGLWLAGPAGRVKAPIGERRPVPVH